MELSTDGKFLVLLADGKPQKVDAESGKLGAAEDQRRRWSLDQADERAYIFEHAWRQFKEKFYLPQTSSGLDWDFYHAAYRRFLPHINNNYDFAEMLSEMLGEVNVSHTGCWLPLHSAQLRTRRRRSGCSTTTTSRRRREGGRGDRGRSARQGGVRGSRPATSSRRSTAGPYRRAATSPSC